MSLFLGPRGSAPDTDDTIARQDETQPADSRSAGEGDRWSVLSGLLQKTTGRLHLDPEPAPVSGWPTLDGSGYLFDLVVIGVLRQASWTATRL